MPEYLYTSQRLGFRSWTLDDLPELAEMNKDSEVMEFFPKRYTKEESRDFLLRMQGHFKQNGYCYFAVDTLSDQKFIGFIGLCNQSYEAPFTPCVDIGWRLLKTAWNYGYATEGARATLEYGFQQLKLHSIYSVAPEVNKKSEKIIQKIGMKPLLTFDHPALKDFPTLTSCIVYISEAI